MRTDRTLVRTIHAIDSLIADINEIYIKNWHYTEITREELGHYLRERYSFKPSRTETMYFNPYIRVEKHFYNFKDLIPQLQQLRAESMKDLSIRFPEERAFWFPNE